MVNRASQNAPTIPYAFPYAFLEAFGNKATTINAVAACGSGRVVRAIERHTSIGARVRLTAIAEKFEIWSKRRCYQRYREVLTMVMAELPVKTELGRSGTRACG